MSQSRVTEVRGVLLPLQGGQLLLPNAAVNEIVGFHTPDPIENNDTDWLLGRIEWRQQKVPMISFEAILGLPKEEAGYRARIAICNTLNGNAKCPYVGILLRSIPRLTRVTEDSIAPFGEPGDAGAMVARQVKLHGQEAWIPDFDALEQRVLALSQE